MKYLSDLLYVDVATSAFTGRTRTYQVFMESPTFTGCSVDYDLSPSWNTTLIYTGSIYGTGNEVRIHLNDIVESYVYDNSYVYEAMERKDDFVCVAPDGVLFHIYIKLEDGTEYRIEADPYIMNYYRDAKVTEQNNMQDLGNSPVPANYNLLFQRTSILPRIPRLVTMTDRFWVGGLFGTTLNWVGNAATATYLDNEFRIVGRIGDVLYNKNAVKTQFRGLVQGFTLKGEKYYDIVHEADEVVFASSNALDSGSSFGSQVCTPIAKVDHCPAEYYLIWIDRTGAYQCQPFTGKNRLTESISTSYTTNLINTEKVSNKQIANVFTLNSEWLTYDEYKAFESIFTSKYLYLYNTEYDEGYEVILTNNEWIEKTRQNKDKMFNLQIKVKSARPQNITY